MEPTVLAVFSSTEFEENVFRRAVELAAERGARLVLLDVRHLRRADRLKDSLASSTYLGGDALEELRASVERQRGRAVRRALEEFARRARARGLAVETVTVKGGYADSVLAVAREVSAHTVVMEHRPEARAVRGPFEAVRV